MRTNVNEYRVASFASSEFAASACALGIALGLTKGWEMGSDDYYRLGDNTPRMVGRERRFYEQRFSVRVALAGGKAWVPGGVAFLSANGRICIILNVIGALPDLRLWVR
jgi:hypothetical protein